MFCGFCEELFPEEGFADDCEAELEKDFWLLSLCGFEEASCFDEETEVLSAAEPFSAGASVLSAELSLREEAPLFSLMVMYLLSAVLSEIDESTASCSIMSGSFVLLSAQAVIETSIVIIIMMLKSRFITYLLCRI